MAKKKTEEIVEEVKTEEIIKDKQVVNTKEEPISKINLQAKELQDKRDSMKKLYMISDTPYVSEPNQFLNVSGIIKKGKICYVEEEIDNGDKGKFWKVGNKQYINKNWKVEEWS